MYAMRRLTSPCVGSRKNVVITPLVLGEVRRSARGRRSSYSWSMNAGSDDEAEDRHGDEAADQRAEAERRGLEEDVARVALDLLVVDIRQRGPRSSAGRAAPPARGSGGSGSAALGVPRYSCVASRDPEEAEDDGDDDAGRRPRSS